MNILMLTNTYLPFTGGVERSIETFAEDLRKRGHRVVIVAPEYEDLPAHELDVIRVPALQHFNGTDFSVQLPIPGIIAEKLEEFVPDIVHSHHPFLLGDAAVRLAARFRTPLVFTFHTFFERYTHYVPLDSERLKRFVVSLASGYANLCNQVIAPSHAVAEELKRRGVVTKIEVIPTGIDLPAFASGDRSGFRKRLDIPLDAMVAGFVSRLAPEKNVTFLAQAVTAFMRRNEAACFLVVGEGPSKGVLSHAAVRQGVADRLRFAGTLGGKELIDAYHAMDCFAYASTSETQGMVIAEALAVGCPIVALDTPVVSEMIVEGKEGFLVHEQDIDEFAAALSRFGELDGARREVMGKAARSRAEYFSRDRCADRLAAVYEQLRLSGMIYDDNESHLWRDAIRRIRAEWNMLGNLARATGAAFQDADKRSRDTRTGSARTGSARTGSARTGSARTGSARKRAAPME